jgi:hypothetical protein
MGSENARTFSGSQYFHEGSTDKHQHPARIYQIIRGLQLAQLLLTKNLDDIVLRGSNAQQIPQGENPVKNEPLLSQKLTHKHLKNRKLVLLRNCYKTYSRTNRFNFQTMKFDSMAAKRQKMPKGVSAIEF